MRSIGSSASAASMSPSVPRTTRSLGPGGAGDDRDRAVGAVERRQLGDDPRQRVDGEVDGERGAGGAEGRQRLARRHRRGAAGDAGEHQALRHLRDGQLAAERGGGGGEGRHAGRQRVGDAAALEPADLLGDGAPDREVAGVQPRHVLAGGVRRRRIRPRSRRATAARCRRGARPAGNAPAAPAARSSRRRGRPGSGRAGRGRAR